MELIDEITLIRQGNSRYVRSQESKSKGAGDAQAHDGPTGLDNGGVGETGTGVPEQVTKAVQAVVGEGEGHDGLEHDLGGDRESTKSGNQRGRLQVPAKEGRGKVGSREEVERAGESDTANTVQGGQDPANLRTVDTQVRRDWAVQALLGQDLSRVLGVGGRGSKSIDVFKLVVDPWILANDVLMRGATEAATELTGTIEYEYTAIELTSSGCCR